MTPHAMLIIDNDEQIQIFLRRVLEQAEYLVLEASNDQEGRLQFRQTPTTPVIITDLFMLENDDWRSRWPCGGNGHRSKLSSSRAAQEIAMYLIPHVLGAHRSMKPPITIAELLQAVEQELQDGAPHKEDSRQEKRRSTQHNRHSVRQSSNRVSPGFRCPCY